MSHGALYVAFRNFLEAGNDDEVLDDELGLDSSLCLLRQSSLKQSMLVSIRKEYQFKFCFPSLIIAAHSIRKQLSAGPDSRIRNELTWTLCEIKGKLFIKIRERFAGMKNISRILFLNRQPMQEWFWHKLILHRTRRVGVKNSENNSVDIFSRKCE